MNNTNAVFVGTSVPNNIIQKNVLAWQEAKREQTRRVRVAREVRSFRENFGRVRFTLPKGFVLGR